MARDAQKCESAPDAGEFPAPALDCLPPAPKAWRPRIGLIGCGGISVYHLAAYRKAGWEVAALCDVDESKARERQASYYPSAKVFSDYRQLLARDDVDVIDAATHPEVRAGILADALRAGKHALSQKPFALDLDEGERLADLAEEKGLKLAVNQNGRWAPHFAWIGQAIDAGLIGEVQAIHLAVHWDHSWTIGTPFDEIRHLVLYDFGIHWFDILCRFMGQREPLRVHAAVARAAGQANKAPLLAHAAVEYDGAQATLIFDAATKFGASDQTMAIGTKGTLRSAGPDLCHQTVELAAQQGRAVPALEGEWFDNGFRGAMGELLCAIEENREPSNNARANLRSLALCFAAMQSADTGLAVKPGDARQAAK